MSIEIKESDFRNFYLNTRNIDKKIARQLATRLKKVGKEVIPDVQRAVLAIPSDKKSEIKSQEPKGLGLRASIAASITVGIKSTKRQSGVFIRVDQKKFKALSGGRTETLPKLLDGTIKRWKHPVFGRNMDHPEKWPIQRYHRFFGRTIYKHKPEAQKEVEKAFMETFEEINKKGLRSKR